jgi:hypothetical protein
MRKAATLTALGKLSRQRYDPARVREFLQEVNSGNDRSVAIVWGALVEDALQSALTKRFNHLNADQREILFGFNGLLNDFASKSIIAYAATIVDADKYRHLTIIREIRNAFAHTMPSLTFDTKEVVDACAMLQEPNRRILKSETPRIVYSIACLRLWQDFHGHDSAFAMDMDTGAIIPLTITLGDEVET